MSSRRKAAPNRLTTTRNNTFQINNNKFKAIENYNNSTTKTTIFDPLTSLASTSSSTTTISEVEVNSLKTATKIDQLKKVFGKKSSLKKMLLFPLASQKTSFFNNNNKIQRNNLNSISGNPLKKLRLKGVSASQTKVNFIY